MATNRVVHPRVLSNDSIELLMQTRATAMKELSELCSGERRFTMSVPVQDNDTDEVFMNCFDAMERLYLELKRMRGEIKVMLGEEYDMPDGYRVRLMAIVFDGKK